MATCNLSWAPTVGGRLRFCWLAVTRLRPVWLANVGNRSLIKGCCLARQGLSSIVVVVRRHRRRRRRQHHTKKSSAENPL